ncbi:uncharacterized protein N7459_000012 [Penicillium hispanicum]|uniref:uncharacterized protein n=1 Tax=Penicillium hispanicum TaxID=1080232 RepID=UPI00254064FE|nr:uncharacterized protein N7459_000012 [Penicillium hispanicum]KAJ5593804.1 hypothetical protein N7459_000012 [Penicillium hispanicum]
MPCIDARCTREGRIARAARLAAAAPIAPASISLGTGLGGTLRSYATIDRRAVWSCDRCDMALPWTISADDEREHKRCTYWENEKWVRGGRLVIGLHVAPLSFRGPMKDDDDRSVQCTYNSIMDERPMAQNLVMELVHDE